MKERIKNLSLKFGINEFLIYTYLIWIIFLIMLIPIAKSAWALGELIWFMAIYIVWIPIIFIWTVWGYKSEKKKIDKIWLLFFMWLFIFILAFWMMNLYLSCYEKIEDYVRNWFKIRIIKEDCLVTDILDKSKWNFNWSLIMLKCPSEEFSTIISNKKMSIDTEHSEKYRNKKCTTEYSKVSKEIIDFKCN